MPNEELVNTLRARLPDKFCLRLLDGALSALNQTDNPMRTHQFAATFRELIDYALGLMGPDAEVMRCTWFVQQKERPGPTLRQRAMYACRGGLTDVFIKDTLRLKPNEMNTELSSVFKALNEQTHIRPNTEMTDTDEIEEFANNAIETLNTVFDTIEEVRENVISRVESEIQGEALSGFLGATVQELDEISGRYSTDIVWIDGAKVVSLDADTIKYHAAGSVDVTLSYGSGPDGAEIKDSFAFDGTMTAPAADPTAFDGDATALKVDTSSWYE